MLISLYVLVDEWWQQSHPPVPRRPGRPSLPSPSEVPTLAVLAQWPRWRSERDFFRFAEAHLREHFPNLLSHGQLNRLLRALEPKLKAYFGLEHHRAKTLNGLLTRLVARWLPTPAGRCSTTGSDVHYTIWRAF